MGRFKGMALGALGATALLVGVASAGTVATSPAPRGQMTAAEAQAKIDRLHQRLAAARSKPELAAPAPASPKLAPAPRASASAAPRATEAPVPSTTPAPEVPATTPSTQPAANPVVQGDDDQGWQDDDQGWSDDDGWGGGDDD